MEAQKNLIQEDEKVYKARINSYAGMLPSDLTGSLDDFLISNSVKEVYGRNFSFC